MGSFFSLFVYRLYQGLIWCLSPFLCIYLIGRLFKEKEDAKHFFERFGFSKKKRPEGPLIWIHAVSVGESLAALPLIDALLNKNIELHILITTGTVTSARLMRQRLPARAMHQFIPIDHPLCISMFLEKWTPSCVLWLESELWPLFLCTIKKRRIPSILINARVSDGSYRRWSRFSSLVRFLLGQFDLCLAQSPQMAFRLRSLGAAHIRMPGNLKFAAAPLPVDIGDLAYLKGATEGRPLLLAASTHYNEESKIGELHIRLKEKFPGFLTIIVPRHPDRGVEIYEELSEKGLNVIRRSTGKDIAADTDVYIADTLGELGLFYRLCPIVIMGGSFVSIGGHNPIEPALLESVLLFGPHMENFPDVVEKFERHEAAFQVKDMEEAFEKIKKLLEDSHFCFEMAERARKVAKSEHAVLGRILEDIKPYLPLSTFSVKARPHDKEK